MITFDKESSTWKASYSKRHPITRKPVTLRRIGIKTQAEAKRVYNELVVLVNKSLDKTGSEQMLWKDFLPEYFRELDSRDWSKATIECYSLCLNAHTLGRWGNWSLKEISGQEIKSLIKDTLKEKSVAHQKSMRKYLNSAFNFALENGYISYNPVPRLQFRETFKLKLVLKDPEVAILLAKAEEYQHPWRTIWTSAVYTGMRSCELFALRWANVDFDNRQIKVVEAWTKKDGFKNKLKNGEDRIIEIAPAYLVYLKQMFLEKEGPFVHPHLDDWLSGRQSEVLRTFLLGININRINFHALRATWATSLLSKGVEAVKVMKLGGWSDLKTLNRHYLRLSGVDVKGTTDLLDFGSNTNFQD